MTNAGLYVSMQGWRICGSTASVTARQARASRQVYQALREAIITAQLAPGQRISENRLAERLAVSRTPVREALIRLQDERFVQIVPQLGTFVTRISSAAVEDAQFIREALECAAVRIAASCADDGDIAALRGLVRRQAEVSAEGAYERLRGPR